MTWTGKRPTAPGDYWLKRDNGYEAEHVAVALDGQRLVVTFVEQGSDVAGELYREDVDRIANALWHQYIVPQLPPKAAEAHELSSLAHRRRNEAHALRMEALNLLRTVFPDDPRVAELRKTIAALRSDAECMDAQSACLWDAALEECP